MLTWIVGIRRLPFYLAGGERPWMAVVMERGTGLALAQRIWEKTEKVDVRQVFRQAMRRPAAGAPRVPDDVVVESEREAKEIARVFKGPVSEERKIPEIEHFTQAMEAHFSGGGAPKGRERSYFDDGLDPVALRDLFEAALPLLALTPWMLLEEDDLIRVDVPPLGVVGACLSVIGRLGESRTLLLFGSYDHWNAFVGAAQRVEDEGFMRFEPARPGASLLAVDFDDQLVSSRMRTEVEQIGLKGVIAHPVPYAVDSDGLRRPIKEDEVATLIAVARALTSLCVKHGRGLADRRAWPLCETYADPAGKCARLTLPYEMADQFEINAPRPQRDPGRNDPCSCGSGKKYRVCHLERDAAERRSRLERDQREERTNRLITGLTGFLLDHDPKGVAEAQRAEHGEDDETLALHWALFHRGMRAPRGSPPGAHALRHRGLVSADREWLQAQMNAWVSIWHVVATKSASGPQAVFSLVDLLTGEIRPGVEVDARTGSRLRAGDVFLGRVVDFPWGSEIVGRAAGVLPKNRGQEVALAAQQALKGEPVECAALRSHRGSRVVMKGWAAAVKLRRAAANVR